MIKKRLIFAILLFILWGSQAAKSDKSTSPARWKFLYSAGKKTDFITIEDPKDLDPGFYSVEYTSPWYRDYSKYRTLYDLFFEHPIYNILKCLITLRKDSRPQCLSLLPIDLSTQEQHIKSEDADTEQSSSVKFSPTKVGTLIEPRLRSMSRSSISTPSVADTRKSVDTRKTINARKSLDISKSSDTRKSLQTSLVSSPWFRSILNRIAELTEKKALYTPSYTIEYHAEEVRRPTTPQSVYPSYETIDREAYESIQKSIAEKARKSHQSPTTEMTYEMPITEISATKSIDSQAQTTNLAISKKDEDNHPVIPDHDFPALEEMFLYIVHLADLFIFNPLDLMFVSFYTHSVHIFALFHGFIGPSWSYTNVIYNFVAFVVLSFVFYVLSILINMLKFAFILILSIPFTIIAGVISLDNAVIALVLTLLVVFLWNRITAY